MNARNPLHEQARKLRALLAERVGFEPTKRY